MMLKRGDIAKRTVDAICVGIRVALVASQVGQIPVSNEMIKSMLHLTVIDVMGLFRRFPAPEQTRPVGTRKSVTRGDRPIHLGHTTLRSVKACAN